MLPLNNKHNILFVGAFKASGRDGNVGGQLFACRTLINSHLQEKYYWILIDSTASTNKSRMLLERLYRASLRMLKFIFRLVTNRKIGAVIIFSSSGFSLKEKGLMALIARIFFQRPIIFAPRSGLILDDLEKSKFNRWWLRTVLKKVDRVLCQSTIWQTYYQELVGNEAEKYVVIENWIDPSKYNENRPNYLLKEEHEKLNILYLGWVNKNKGIFDVIAAAGQLKHQNVRFIIAGDGDELDHAIKVVKAQNLEDLFDFKGWVRGKRKLALLQEADIFVLPSHREGYPNALLEAMASGIPTLASKVGSIPDIIEDNETGLLFEAGHSEQLAGKLDLLISNGPLRKKLARNGRNKLAVNNTMEQAMNKFEILLDEILSDSNRQTFDK